MSNRLDPDCAGHFVRPDLDPICWQKLPADDARRQKGNLYETDEVFHKI